MEQIADTPGAVTCPHCGLLTDSLKQYRYVNWLVFLLLGALWWSIIIRACPSCMRRIVWRRCLLNLVPANFLWPFLLLPWALVLTASSYRRSPSRNVVQGISPVEQARRLEAASNPNLADITLAGWLFGLSSVAVGVGGMFLVPVWLAPHVAPGTDVGPLAIVPMLVYMGVVWGACKWFGIRFLKRCPC